MHKDITKIIHEFEHSGHKTTIVERKMQNHLFLYFYVYDLKYKDREVGGMNYSFFGAVTEEDLKDLLICVPKIKECIDVRIAQYIKWDEEKAQKKKATNWTGQSFNRGDYVYFKGNNEFAAQNSFVWTHFAHLSLEYYLIQHKDGRDRSNWMAKPPFENHDGFECVHSSQLNETIKYIQIDCSQDFQGETDELVLLKASEK